MTRKERFSAFLNNRPVDRVPVAIFHHFCKPRDFGKGVTDRAAFERNIEGHRLARKVFDPDVAKVMNDTLMLLPLDCSFAEKASDLRKIEPVSMDSEFVSRTRELTKRVREIYGDTDAPLYGTSFSPYTVLRFSLSGKGMLGNGGDEHRFKQYMAEDPEAVSDALDILGQRIMELNRMLISECGVDGIYLAVNNQNNIVPPELHRKYIAPHEKALIEDANKLSGINLLHICGGPLAVPSGLETFADYPVAAINWAIEGEKVPLGRGKKILGGKPVFGGFERSGVLDKGTREEVEARVFNILDEAGQVGIMMGADCTVPTDIDDNRLEWVRQAVIKYAEKRA